MQNVWTYYIEGLMRQGNAALARKYLGLGDTDIVTFGYTKNSTPLWNDVRIPLSGAGPGTSPPDFTTNFIGGIKAWRFVNAAPAKSLHFELQLPHGFNQTAGLGIRLHLHWSSPTNIAALAQVVEWNLEIAIANLNAQFHSVAGVVGATTTYTATGATSSTYQHVETDFVNLSGMTDSGIVVGRLSRSVGAGDTYGGDDVFALSLDAHYTFLQAGSTTEFP